MPIDFRSQDRTFRAGFNFFFSSLFRPLSCKSALFLNSAFELLSRSFSSEAIHRSISVSLRLEILFLCAAYDVRHKSAGLTVLSPLKSSFAILIVVLIRLT